MRKDGHIEKVSFIGGTGAISTAISKQLIRDGSEIYILNRFLIDIFLAIANIQAMGLSHGL